MQIAIELPNDFVMFQSEPTLRQEISTSYALWLYQRERVTLAKAAKLAGLDLYDFMAACKDSLVPVVDISRQELLDELGRLSPA